MHQKQKGFAPIIIIGIVVLVLAIAGGIGYYLINKQFSKQAACTTEIKACLDGSSVARTGPNCEFAECPEINKQQNLSENEKSINNFKGDNYGTGLLTVSNISNPVLGISNYGKKDVPLLSFNLNIDQVEDVNLSGVAIEFYTEIYGEELRWDLLRNMRLIDENGDIYSQVDALSSFHETATDRSWSYTTTYAWFNGNVILQKNTNKTFTLLADIPQNSSFKIMHALLPSGTGNPESTFGKGISAHFKTIGVDSNQQPQINGEASGVVYIKNSDNPSIILRQDSSFKATYPRISKDVILSKFYIEVGKEKDVEISEIALRITNFVPSQFKNIKLLENKERQYGFTVDDPLETTGVNVIFNDKLVIKAGSIANFELIADTFIPSDEDSEYGTQLQREVQLHTVGITTKEDVFKAGYVDTWLEFY